MEIFDNEIWLRYFVVCVFLGIMVIPNVDMTNYQQPSSSNARINQTLFWDIELPGTNRCSLDTILLSQLDALKAYNRPNHGLRLSAYGLYKPVWNVATFNQSEFQRYLNCMCDTSTQHCDVHAACGKVVNSGQIDNDTPCSQNNPSIDAISKQMNTSVVHLCKRYPRHTWSTNSVCEYKLCNWSEVHLSWDITDMYTESLHYDSSEYNPCHFKDDEDVSTTDEHGSGSSSSSTEPYSNTTSEVMNDNDGPLSDTVIGIIVAACVIITIILIMGGVLLWLRRRRNTKSNNDSLSSGPASSTTNIEREPGRDFQKNDDRADQRIHGKPNGLFRPPPRLQSSTNGLNFNKESSSSAERGVTERHTRNNTYTAQNNNANRGASSQNIRVTSGEPTYDSIDAALGIQSEYSTLDDFTNYNHMYRTVSDGDPKHRPAMPLPPHIKNQTLPYYSVADPTVAGSSNQDTVSAQYLELFDENVSIQPISGTDYLLPIFLPPMASEQVVETHSYVSLYSD